jgi:hypothetical protein
MFVRLEPAKHCTQVYIENIVDTRNIKQYSSHVVADNIYFVTDRALPAIKFE